MPGFIGLKIIKPGFRCVFKNAHGHFAVGLGDERGEAEFAAGLVLRGFALYRWVAQVFTYRWGSQASFDVIDAKL